MTGERSIYLISTSILNCGPIHQSVLRIYYFPYISAMWSHIYQLCLHLIVHCASLFGGVHILHCTNVPSHLATLFGGQEFVRLQPCLRFYSMFTTTFLQYRFSSSRTAEAAFYYRITLSSLHYADLLLIEIKSRFGSILSGAESKDPHYY